MPKILPLNENALLVDFGQVISEELNDRVLSIARFFEEKSFSGIEEVCPAYSSVAIFYQPMKIRQNFPESKNAFEAVKSLVEQALSSENRQKKHERLIQIPVSFDNAPDLEFVATWSNLSCEEVIEIFLSRIYRVYMLGFLPGFAYMGKVSGKIAAPRHKTPRKLVEKGSVAIAGRQTGIYPFNSPGGWQIIGKTEIEMFDPKNPENPTFLKPGDSVKFIRV
ncbi:MAG: 5-oxoprolinase subunit PxpB [Acidobacteriota bacterium]|nr:5-oxoprolinase subunit PxpB [Pyrinomonadaceae bacterium]MDW8305001.1 5-oxoprolinase subunit PxpB [Acidobacteriota bacterium]